MKKTVIMLCMAFLCLATLPTFAQVKFGVKAGVSTTSVGVDFEDKDEEDEAKDALKLRIGYTLGLAAEIGFTDALSLQTGLNLNNKGYRVEGSGDGFSYKENVSVTYLELPINLAFKINKFQVHAGPYIAFGVAGKSKYEYNGGGISESGDGKIKFKNEVSDSDWDDLEDDEEFARRTDVGLNLGAGYRFGPVLVTATYSKGFSNIIPTYEGEDDDYKLTNKVISLAATWFF